MPNLQLAPLLSKLTIQTKDLTTERFDLSGPFAWAQREFLAEIERQYNQEKPVRIIVLKARQLGISTAMEGVLFYWAFLHKGTSGLVIAHETESATSLFEKTKLYWESWPYKSLYHARYASQKRLTWEPSKSTIRVATAKNLQSGRGSTIHAVHASECAFYPDPDTLFTGLGQTIPHKHGSILVLESTANGLGNWFSDQWDQAEAGANDYTPMFFPWWRHYEYRQHTTLCVKSELTADERHLLLLMRRDGRIPEDDCFQALEWRRWAIKNLANHDEDYFMQEYPATPSEAFMSTGRNVFPLQKVDECYVAQKGHRGTLVEDNRGKVKWTPDPSGNLTVFKAPSTNRRQDLYFIAGDPTKTVMGDPACMQVINRQTYEQVAVWHGHIDPINFGREMMLVGKWYNNATLCPEVEGGGQATIATILNLNYPNVWMHHWADKAPGQVSGTNYGWSSNFQRKNWAIGRLKYLFAETSVTIHDRETYNQIRNYVTKDNGEMGNAGKLGHDDAVMALAIGVTASQTEGPVPLETPRQPETMDIFDQEFSGAL